MEGIFVVERALTMSPKRAGTSNGREGTTLTQQSEGAKVTESFTACLDRAARAWGLTPRQREVLAQVAGGKSNKEVAAHLGCAVHTVEIHMTEVLRRSGRASRGALIAGFWTQS